MGEDQSGVPPVYRALDGGAPAGDRHQHESASGLTQGRGAIQISKSRTLPDIAGKGERLYHAPTVQIFRA